MRNLSSSVCCSLIGTGNKRQSRTILFTVVALGTMLVSGCHGPTARPSRLMQRGGAPTGPPPTGKSQVQIHRPRAAQGGKLYTGIWEGNNFVGDLGNGNSIAYVCDPGTHYFINRSVERVGVVETQLLPDQTYDLWVDICGAWVASFQLEPVKHGSKQAKRVPEWMKKHQWVTRGPTAEVHEQQRQKDIEIIVKDFVEGDKKDRLRHLGPEEHE